MSEFAKPAGLGSVIPSSPAQGVTIGSNDQLVLDYVIGKTIIAGSQFSDTLGRFSPVIINQTGITINSSAAGTSASAIVFHNTGSAGTDVLITLGSGNALGIVPNSSTSVNNAFVVADRTRATYLGWIVYPALTSGGTTQPELDLSSPAGTANAIYRFGTNYIQFLGVATNFTPTIYTLGGDTNIGLIVIPKGSGAFQVGDAAAKNVILFSPAPSGSTPSISIQGVDTNINLGLVPKGTGVLQTGYAAIALGGGAAPTLGTIGGSGPANAAQYRWLKIATADAAAVFIPVWT